jgi:hypothetical protein
MLIVNTKFSGLVKLLELLIVLTALFLLSKSVAGPKVDAQESQDNFRSLLQQENDATNDGGIFLVVPQVPIFNKTELSIADGSDYFISHIGEDFVCFSRRVNQPSGSTCIPLSNIGVLVTFDSTLE